MTLKLLDAVRMLFDDGLYAHPISKYFIRYLASLRSAERQNIAQNLPNLTDWYVKTCSQVIFATAGEHRFMLCGVG